MERPRVLVVTGAYFPELSGGALQAQTIISALRDRVSFTVLTTCTNPMLPAEGLVDGIPVHRVQIDLSKRWSKLGAAARMVQRLFAIGGAIDVLHLHGFSRKSILLISWARLRRIPVVLTITTAGFDEPAGVLAMGRMAYWFYSSADLFTAVSPRLAQSYLAAGLPAARLRTVPNVVDTGRFHPAAAEERQALRARLGLRSDVFWILFVGFFSRDKAPDVLFEAWRIAEPSLPPTGLVFVGATSSRYFEVDADLVASIRGRARLEGIDDRVQLVEPTPSVEDYFRAADMFVLPSTREGLPIALLEAMACELPIVASRLPGVTDTVVENGESGLLVPPRDPESLAHAIRTLVSDAALARRIGIAARVAVVARFGIDQTAERWRDVYRQVREQ